MLTEVYRTTMPRRRRMDRALGARGFAVVRNPDGSWSACIEIVATSDAARQLGMIVQSQEAARVVHRYHHPTEADEVTHHARREHQRDARRWRRRMRRIRRSR